MALDIVLVVRGEVKERAAYGTEEERAYPLGFRLGAGRGRYAGHGVGIGRVKGGCLLLLCLCGNSGSVKVEVNQSRGIV